MNLKEFKNIIDTIEKRVCAEEIEVLITTSESTVGGRAYSRVKGITLGFDWERNQLRIEPNDKLIKKK